MSLCAEFFGYSDVDSVYKLGQYESVADSSSCINSDNEGIPSSRSPSSIGPRGKFCLVFINPKQMGQ